MLMCLFFRTIWWETVVLAVDSVDSQQTHLNHQHTHPPQPQPIHPSLRNVWTTVIDVGGGQIHILHVCGTGGCKEIAPYHVDSVTMVMTMTVTTNEYTKNISYKRCLPQYLAAYKWHYYCILFSIHLILNYRTSYNEALNLPIGEARLATQSIIILFTNKLSYDPTFN